MSTRIFTPCFVLLWAGTAALTSCSDTTPQSGVDGGLTTLIEDNLCPDITSVVISPSTIGIGSEAQLTAEVRDVNGDPLVHMWFAETGTVANPRNLDTPYRCTTPGHDAVVFSVADVHGCVSQKEGRVRCLE